MGINQLKNKTRVEGDLCFFDSEEQANTFLIRLIWNNLDSAIKLQQMILHSKREVLDMLS